eukprot:m.329746 g.329746  ORF g.329746 m.329746 type:complete len:2649 (+) comp16040_c1_seq2:1183-9129(+)
MVVGFSVFDNSSTASMERRPTLERRPSMTALSISTPAPPSPYVSVLPATAEATTGGGVGIGSKYICIGDSVCLLSRQTVGNGAGFLFCEDSFQPQPLLFPVSDEVDPEVQNAHAMVFDLFVAYDYTFASQFLEARDEAEKLEDQLQDIKEQLVGRLQSKKKVKKGRGRRGVRSAAATTKSTGAAAANLEKEKVELEKKLREANLRRKQCFDKQRQELKSNVAEQDRQLGNPICYGDKIQLRHRLTNKFLSVKDTQTASSVASVAITLQEHYDNACLFEIFPRFRIRSHGETVREGDEILLKSVQTRDYYLGHSSQTLDVLSKQAKQLETTQSAKLKACMEIHASAKTHPWIIQLFSQQLVNTQAVVDDSMIPIRGGDVIQIIDRDKNCYLSLLPKSQTAAVTTSSASLSEFVLAGNDQVDDDGELSHESLSFWQVEISGRALDGSVLTNVERGACQCRLRHLATNQYLAYQMTDDDLSLALLTEQRSPQTNFDIYSVNDGITTITSNSNTLIRTVATTKPLYMHSRVAAAGLNHAIDILFREEQSQEDVFTVRLVSEEAVDDFNYAKGLQIELKFLRTITQRDRALAYEHMQPMQQEHRRAVLKRGEACMKEMADFLRDQDDDDLGEVGEARYQRQGLFQDLGLFSDVVACITGPIRGDRQLSEGIIANPVAYQELKDFWEDAFRVLYQGARGEHTETDRYISSAFDEFLQHMLFLKTEYASETLLELVNDTREIIDDLTAKPSELGRDVSAENDVSVFEELLAFLRRTNPSTQVRVIDHDYYNLLSSFCVCDGLAVSVAQDACHKVLLKDQVVAAQHTPKFFLKNQSELWIAVPGAEPERLSSLFARSMHSAQTGADYMSPKDESINAFVMTLVAQLNLFRAITDGNFQEGETSVKAILSQEFLLQAVRDANLSLSLRCVFLDILFEVYVDSSDFQGHPFITRQQLVFLASDSSDDKPGDSADPVQVAIKQQFHQWYTNDFGSVLTSFVHEMNRIIRDDDDFLDAHRGHATFILSTLGVVKFFLEYGFYDRQAASISEEDDNSESARKELSQVFDVLNKNFFELMKSLPSDENILTAADDVSNELDEERNVLISQVLTRIVEIVELMLMYQTWEAQRVLFRMFQSSSTRAQSSFIPGFQTRTTGLSDFAELESDELHMHHDAASALLQGVLESTSFQAMFDYSASNLALDLSRISTCLFPEVTREAFKCIEMLHSRTESLAVMRDAGRIAAAAPSITAYQHMMDEATLIYSVCYDQQIDVDEAEMMTNALNRIVADLKRDKNDVLLPSVQQTLTSLNLVDDILSVFDQKLDDEFLITPEDNNVQTMLVTCVNVLIELTKQNLHMQNLIFQELPGLLANDNLTMCSRVTRRVGVLFKAVFDAPILRLKIQTTHMVMIVDLICRFYEKGEYLTELVDVLCEVSKPFDSSRSDVELTSLDTSPIQVMQRHTTNVLEMLHDDIPAVNGDNHERRDFYMKLVMLLGICAQSDNAFIESTCRKLFPIDRLASCLQQCVREEDEYGFAAFLNFLAASQTKRVHLLKAADSPLIAAMKDHLPSCFSFTTRFVDAKLSDDVGPILFQFLEQWVPFHVMSLEQAAKQDESTADFAVVEDVQFWLRGIYDDLEVEHKHAWMRAMTAVVGEDQLAFVLGDRKVARKQSIAASKAGVTNTFLPEHDEGVLDEEQLNTRFRAALGNFFDAFYNENHAFHPCSSNVKEADWTCPYTQPVDQEAGVSARVMPLGPDFQERIDLLQKHNDTIFDDAPQYQTVCTCLQDLAEIVFDPKAPDARREDAEELSCRLLIGLAAIPQRYLCQLESPELDGVSGVARREQIVGVLQQRQAELAECGAVFVAVRFLTATQSRVFRSAWLLLTTLCAGGNIGVQQYLRTAFAQAEGQQALLQVQTQLAAKLHFLVQLQHRQVRILAASSALKDAESNVFLDNFKSSIEHQLEATRSWLLNMFEGIQQLAEGANQDIQDLLRGSEGTVSVNFVKELSRSLKLLFEQSRQNMDLIEANLETLVELCQGNQTSQQEALDEQIVKSINSVLDFEIVSEDMTHLQDVMTVKHVAVITLEAFLERSNVQAQVIAGTLVQSLDLKQLRQTMNEFYYLNNYLRQTKPVNGTDQMIRDQLVQRLQQAGYETYFVFARLEDLGHYDASSFHQQKGVSAVMSGGSRPKKSKKKKGKDGDNPSNVTKLKSAVAISRMFRGANPSVELDQYSFFQANSLSIEFIRHDAVQKVYFKKPDVELSETARDQISLQLDRSTPEDKVRSFLSKFQAINSQRLFRERLKSSSWYGFLVGNHTHGTLRWIFLLLTLVLNILMLAGYVGDTNGTSSASSNTIQWLNYVLGSLHVFFALGLVVIAVIGRVEALKGVRLNVWGYVKAWFPTMFYYLALVTASVLSLIWTKKLYPFHLFHVVPQNDILLRAIESITRNGISLIYVVMLGVIVVYILSYVAFLYMNNIISTSPGLFCESSFECFVSILGQGMLLGGGVGEILNLPSAWGKQYGWVIVYELAFWILVSVIMMNLVLGIIVDTFSELRSERAATEEDKKSVCYICGLPRYAFDRVKGFDHHILKEHNMWAYVYYVAYLESLSRTSRNYHETHLFEMLVVKKDPTPFPTRRCLALSTQFTQDALEVTGKDANGLATATSA